MQMRKALQILKIIFQALNQVPFISSKQNVLFGRPSLRVAGQYLCYFYLLVALYHFRCVGLLQVGNILRCQLA
jgi:hypothetical protein